MLRNDPSAQAVAFAGSGFVGVIEYLDEPFPGLSKPYPGPRAPRAWGSSPRQRTPPLRRYRLWWFAAPVAALHVGAAVVLGVVALVTGDVVPLVRLIAYGTLLSV